MRLTTLALLLFCYSLTANCQTEVVPTGPPNVIIIFADDLGYGDLGVYGHPTIRTPTLDRMAAEGQKWTNFYAGASVCTPSRAALLTGRLPVRSGMTSRERRVLFPNSKYGLPPEEVTLATQLKRAGYATACVGKWHLGAKKPYLPTNHGFDSYYGILYSNDMDVHPDSTAGVGYREFWDTPAAKHVASFRVPLLRGTEIIERPADQRTITRRYTDESIRFIQENSDAPFFLYLAHNLPHIPLFASAEFEGRSERGLYGDVVEEIDHGIGRILESLEAESILDNTVVVFTSDNGPWLEFGPDGGSAGLLRGGKGTTYEGGMREPCIVYAPGRIEPAVITGLGTTMDLFTTFSALAGVPAPSDRAIDGVDLSETFFGGNPSPRERVFYYRGDELYAVRTGAYKMHLVTEGDFGREPRRVHDPPLLYNLSVDPSERHDLVESHPEVLARLRAIATSHSAKMVKGKDLLKDVE